MTQTDITNHVLTMTPSVYVHRYYTCRMWQASVLCVKGNYSCTHLNSDLSTAWAANKELYRSIEVGIQSVLLDWSDCFAPATLHNTVGISTCKQSSSQYTGRHKMGNQWQSNVHVHYKPVAIRHCISMHDACFSAQLRGYSKQHTMQYYCNFKS